MAADDDKSTAPTDGVSDPELVRSNYPDMTDGQFAQFKEGVLPKERKLQAITLIIAVLALFFGIMGMVF